MLLYVTSKYTFSIFKLKITHISEKFWKGAELSFVFTLGGCQSIFPEKLKWRTRWKASVLCIFPYKCVEPNSPCLIFWEVVLGASYQLPYHRVIFSHFYYVLFLLLAQSFIQSKPHLRTLVSASISRFLALKTTVNFQSTKSKGHIFGSNNPAV